ncbi:MAG: hypothetical protein R2939_15610 [Kofleriaceae bacterium]
MNNFRQNLPAFDAFAAPDLTVELSLMPACRLDALVCNEGAVVVGAGVRVSFWDNVTQAELECADAPRATESSLSPGACAVVSCVWIDGPTGEVDVRACVDNGGYACDEAGAGGNRECREGNNVDDTTASVGCQPIG